MHTTDELTDMVLRRANAMGRRREGRILAALSAVSAMLFLCLITLTGALCGAGIPGSVPGLYGATLLFEDAGGYVLVGVVSFAAAAALTAACLLYRQNNKKTEDKNEEEPK